MCHVTCINWLSKYPIYIKPDTGFGFNALSFMVYYDDSILISTYLYTCITLCLFMVKKEEKENSFCSLTVCNIKLVSNPDVKTDYYAIKEN